MIVKLLSEQHLKILSLKRGCTGSSESTHVKMPHCWKSHVTSHRTGKPCLSSHCGCIKLKLTIITSAYALLYAQPLYLTRDK